MDFKIELERRVGYANRAIEKLLPAEDEHPGELAKAMRYSVVSGGKRLRPVIMGECYGIFGGQGDDVQPFMATMEFIHTASLIHDDLPAIDDSILRRGKDTVHYKFGEAVGILAGDAMLNYAYEVLADGVLQAKDTWNAVKAAKIITLKSGYRGMLGGQDADVEREKKGVIEGDKREMINYIYEKKTGCLFEASMMAGAALAGGDRADLEKLEEAGRKLGLAFQIEDDILDVTGTTEKMGKPVFLDMKNERDTYVSLFGLDEAARKVRELTDEAVAIFDGFSGETWFIKELMLSLTSREM